MTIADLLIHNFNSKIRCYFKSKNPHDWKDHYIKNIQNLDHDEPWLTLIACYSVFGSQSDLFNPKRVTAINEIISTSGIKKSFSFTEIGQVILEEDFKEILCYRNYLRDMLFAENYHLYPDRINLIKGKLFKKESSLEGNTQIDLKITGKVNNRDIILFVEAKYLSDISYQIKYNPVRNQIIRIIDTGIDYIISKNQAFNNFYFFLLTPKIFRSKSFGGGKESRLNVFDPGTSRLYNYKMDEYRDYRNIKEQLPHRKNISDQDWQTIADHIGWITYEDFIERAISNATISDQVELELIKEFFIERNLLSP